jgi:[ribosomal protein S5]-alanine N-acetyltransferase
VAGVPDRAAVAIVTTGLSRETARLVLRPLHTGDEGPVFTLLSDERVVRYMLFPLFDRERARTFVARIGQPASGADKPRQAILGIAERSNEKSLVGLCGLVLNPELAEGEAWYLLRPDLWGRGLVTEAARALVTIGFEDLGLHRIWASCLPVNPASARVLEKLGFRREGYLRQNLRIHGVWQDSYLYAVLGDEWGRKD